MLEQVNVFYEGWGERWQWGTLVSTTALTVRPLIVFEYSNEARQRGLELSSYTLPLEGPGYAETSRTISFTCQGLFTTRCRMDGACC